jgi:hypothetical protein
MVPEPDLPYFLKFTLAGRDLLTIETRFGNALLLPIRCEQTLRTVQEFGKSRRENVPEWEMAYDIAGCK